MTYFPILVFGFVVMLYNGLIGARNAFRIAFARQACNNRREMFPGSLEISATVSDKRDAYRVQF